MNNKKIKRASTNSLSNCLKKSNVLEISFAIPLKLVENWFFGPAPHSKFVFVPDMRIYRTTFSESNKVLIAHVKSCTKSSSTRMACTSGSWFQYESVSLSL